MYFQKRESKKNKKGYTWTVKFYYKDEYGIKKRFAKSGFASKADAEKFGIKKQQELLENDGKMDAINLTFDEVFEEYMEVEGKYKYAKSTEMYYRNTYNNHVKKKIGQAKIADLHYLSIQKYFNSLDQFGKATNKNIKKVFCVTFKYAQKVGYIRENPMPMIEIRGIENKQEYEVVTLEQIEQIIDSMLETKQGRKATFSTYSMCVFLYLGYFLGTRKSETLALTKEDVDFENNYIYISKRLEYHGLKRSEYHLTERMKTKGSKSKIPLCLPLKEILLQWFQYNPYDLICCKEDGNFLSPGDLDIVFHNHSKNLGIKFRCHMLRHSFVTNLIHNGVDVKTTAELARHSDIRTTLQIYTQVSEQNKIDAIQDTFNSKNTLVRREKDPILDKRYMS